jgi:hypothetical protein
LTGLQRTQGGEAESDQGSSAPEWQNGEPGEHAVAYLAAQSAIQHFCAAKCSAIQGIKLTALRIIRPWIELVHTN